MINRRDFLRYLLKAGATVPFLGSIATQQLLAIEPNVTFNSIAQTNADGKILVLLRLFGGNDGLNTFIPFNDEKYYTIRNEIKQYPMAIPEANVIKLKGHDSMGFHPAWNSMKELFDEGKMTIIQNVGYPNQDLSHFRSTDIWLSASDAQIHDETGWVGRYLEQKYTGYPDSIPDVPYSIEFASTLSRLSIGKNNNIGFGYIGKAPIPELHYESLVHDSSEPEQQVVINNMKVAKKYLATLNAAMESVPDNLLKYPVYDADFEFNSMADNLSMVARLIAAGISTSIYSLTSDLRFDTHDYHIPYHNSALNAVAGAVSTFQRELELRGLQDKVVLLIYSEFGRRIQPNGTGLDHGSAAPVFIVGSQASGLVIGNNPNLSDLDIFANLKHKIDFRQIYASLLEQWFGERVSTLNPYVFPRGFQTLPVIKGFAPSYVQGVYNTLKIFPNPCSDYLVVNVNGTTVSSVTITSITGQVFSAEFQNDGLSFIIIAVKHLAAGEYIVNIHTSSNQLNTKFIKV